MNCICFGTMPDGQKVEKIILESGEARCSVITCGAAITSLEVPDKDGKNTDVILGFDTLDGYLAHDKFMGAIVGRYANRIGGSRFSLDGAEYVLYANEPPNHLHGGKEGFDKRVWTAAEISGGARFTLRSHHMDEGYPGNLDVTVDYILTGTALEIRYTATTDRDTICSLTNHAYFNLDGHDGGAISKHILKLYSASYTPVADKQCIPTGDIAPVDGTPMDFRVPAAIGERIDADFDQLRFGSGYDHNWVVDGETGILRPAARVFSPKTGISMQVDTTLPGIQFYAGNYLEGCPPAKGSASYKKRGGFCLETQYFPDAPNKPQFSPSILRVGEAWEHTTVFRFDVL